MKLERFLLLLAIAGLSSSYAQSPGGALIPELVKHWQSSKALSLAVAACGNAKHAYDATAENNGYYVRAGDVTYQLQISRELNPFSTEDSV